MGGYFNATQKALYEEVKRAGTLDQQLIKLSELAGREGTNPEDVRTVRRWLSDQVIRQTAR